MMMEMEIVLLTLVALVVLVDYLLSWSESEQSGAVFGLPFIIWIRI